VQLEDSVLQAIIAISKGESSEIVIDGLHSRIEVLADGLGNDNEALNWFDLSTATASPPSPSSLSEIPSTPLEGASSPSPFSTPEIPFTPLAGV